MPLNIKVDEDLPFQVVELVRGAGHNVETVAGRGMGGVGRGRAQGRTLDELIRKAMYEAWAHPKRAADLQ